MKYRIEGYIGNNRYVKKRHLGALSGVLNAVELNIVEWNGQEVFDLRHWSDSGHIPGKGITISKRDFDVFIELVRQAKYANKKTGKCIRECGFGEFHAYIFAEYGNFAESKEWCKKITYIDWGYGQKYDIRAWKKDYSQCGNGVCLTDAEVDMLISIIGEERECGKRRLIRFEDFVVRSHVFKCNKNHDIEDIRAHIDVLLNNGHKCEFIVPAGYCKICKVFFILEADFQRIRAKGIPLCRQVMEESYIKHDLKAFCGENINYHSKLNQIGYNVNSTENLSKEQRQCLLLLAVKNGLYSVIGICNFLDWLIDKNSRVKDRDMSNAIYKWREDRAFLSDLDENFAEKNIGTLRYKR